MNQAHSGAERMAMPALCRTASLKQPVSFRFRPSCGQAQVCVELRLEVLHDPDFGDASGEWTSFAVGVGSFFFFHVALALI